MICLPINSGNMLRLNQEITPIRYPTSKDWIDSFLALVLGVLLYDKYAFENLGALDICPPARKDLSYH